MSGPKKALLFLQAIFYIVAGANHFINPGFYQRIMPPYLPWPDTLHLSAGAIEIGLGLLLLVRRCRRVAAAGLILLLLAVYPANIHVFLNRHLYTEVPELFHWIRLPLQLGFIIWAASYVRDDRATN